MNKYFLWFLCWSWLAFPLGLNGQTDSVMIPTIEIIATKKIKAAHIGGNSQQWKTKHLQSIPSNNLAELLSNEAGVFIKNYGTGSLSTSSIRGGSAGHTLVLWNGVPLQSPMLGLLDLSLLPLSGTEEILFQPGGNSAIWGSGAIGGVLSLNNEAEYNSAFSFSNNTKVGSFGQFQKQLKFSFGNQKFQSVTKLFHQKAENDFPYLIAPHLPEKIQTNAAFSEQNILQDFYWKINPKHQLSLHFWQQFSNKKIPPTIVQNNSIAEQDDLATRLTLDWKNIKENSSSSAKIAFIDEQNNYFDLERLTEARNHFRRWIGEVEQQWSWKNNHQILLGLSHSYTQAWSDGYVGSPKENRSAFFASYLFEKEKWQFQTSLREEFVDWKSSPIVPNIGINYQAFSFLQLKIKASKNYRSATLNDRYWHPVGNVNLLPENGWSQEGSSIFSIKKKNTIFTFSTTGYNRKINNWILWSKLEGQIFWSPNNVAKVWSRGLEQRISVAHQINQLKINWSAGYDFTRSTNLIAQELPKIAKGEQLRYTPVHQAVTKVNLNWKQFNFYYQHQLIGKSEGFNESLPSYSIGNTSLNYKFEKGNCKSIVFFNINNIWNASYFVVERRPMPMRNFQLGINLSFLKSQK